MVVGRPGERGRNAPNHVEREQEQNSAVVPIPTLRMEAERVVEGEK